MAIDWKKGLKWAATPRMEVLKGIPKWAGIGGAVAAGAVALPIVVGSLRNSRRVNEDDLPPPPELSAPIPQVMDFTPQLMAAAQPQTMMGMEPVEGDFAKKYKNQRGAASGIDASSPAIMRPDGRNAIDGSRTIEDLNAPGARGL
jgi:hypothetical protein